MRVITIAKTFFLVLTISASLFLFFQDFKAQEQASEFQELSETTRKEKTKKHPLEDSNSKPLENAPVSETTVYQSSVGHDLLSLQKENPDCIGWVTVPGTTIDYPLMYTPQNPEKYLRMDFSEEYSEFGVPFLDSRCTLESDHFILYGHNMFDGSMFTPVIYFTDKEVMSSHGTIRIEIGGMVRDYRTIAAIHTTIDSPIYQYTDFTCKEELSEFLAAVRKECPNFSELPLKNGLQFVTLSTCELSQKDGRALLIGIREKEVS